MVNLSKFAETLGELKTENNLTAKALAESVGLPPPTLTRYLKAKRMPTVENLIRLADYFNCSTDFLLGREEYSSSLTFRKPPKFSARIAELPEICGISGYEFVKRAQMPESSYFEWKSGASQPTLDSIVKIAENFDCRVDFILGRES